jgi:DNA-binding MurR/RpiR family transcriptional regulator
VAEFLLEAGSRAAPLSAREIAAAVGTSDATVVRTARTLGYQSLRELKRALASNGDDTGLSARLEATIDSSPSPFDLLTDAVDRQRTALDNLVNRVSPSMFGQATAVLSEATHIWWCGTGPSAELANYAAFLCRRLGRAAGALTHAGADHADELLDLQPHHAVVLLAYGRVHRYVRVLLDHADTVGAQVVLITDTLNPRSTTPLAAQLNAGRGAPGHYATHGPTIVLLEALVLAVAAADPVRAAAALDTLNDLRQSIAGRRIDVDPH